MFNKIQNSKDAAKTITETIHRILDYCDSRYSSPGDYFYKKGLECYGKEKYKKAQTLFRKSIERKFEKYCREDAIVKVIRCHIRLCELDKAEEFALSETSIHKNYYNVLFTLGLIYEKKGEEHKALGVYQDILIKDALNENVSLRLGEYYYDKKKYELAVKYYRKYLPSNSYDKEIRLKLIKAYNSLKEYDNSIIEINKLLEHGFSQYEYLLNYVEEIKNKIIV